MSYIAAGTTLIASGIHTLTPGEQAGASPVTVVFAFPPGIFFIETPAVTFSTERAAPLIIAPSDSLNSVDAAGFTVALSSPREVARLHWHAMGERQG
jgi:hypothetical protein